MKRAPTVTNGTIVLFARSEVAHLLPIVIMKRTFAFLLVVASVCVARTLHSQETPKGGSRSLLVVDEPKASESAAIGSGAKKTPAKTVSTKPESDDSDASGPSLKKVERKQLTETASPMGGETYLLRYKFTPGLRLVTEVTHLARNDTKIDAASQDSDSRTVSHKTWDVVGVANGEITFEYRIADIDMSQRIGTNSELKYSSKSGQPAPVQFQAAAESVGKLISTVTIDEQGLIIARSDDKNPPHLGMGDITLPLPENAVAVGATWEIPRELNIKRDDGSIKRVRFREFFKLEKVSLGVATVSVKSEMITIVTEPKEEAQVLQQLSNGTIKFDMDAGRMISKELSWDKKVVGFSGAGSTIEYSSRLDERVTKTETFTPPSKTARR
jgi:hypothetical protein